MSLYKVTVVVPIYNVEKYLEEALLSLVTQSLDNIEIILINDGSTDSSLEIATNFSQKYDFVKLYSQKNQGLSATRNRGISLAKGKYIYFMDSDDFIEKYALEKLFRICEKEDLQVLLFSGQNFYDKEYRGKKNSKAVYIRKEKYISPSSGKQAFKALIDNKEYYSSACLYLIRNSVLEDFKMTFLEGIIHEDELFTYQLLLNAERVGITNEIFFHRRVRENSIITEKNSYKSFIGYKAVLFEMIKYRDSKTNISPELMDSINSKISQIYGFTLNKYIILSRGKKYTLEKDIKKIKDIGKKNNFFSKIEFKVFNNSEFLYLFMYKIGSRMYKLLK